MAFPDRRVRAAPPLSLARTGVRERARVARVRAATRIGIALAPGRVDWWVASLIRRWA